MNKISMYDKSKRYAVSLELIFDYIKECYMHNTPLFYASTWYIR